MALYTIGDLHLSTRSNKPMSIFGEKWKDHESRLSSSFKSLNDDDVTVICGDISWGMTLEECLEDFKLIDSFPGKKILLKGNHDYYWSTAAKINAFFRDNEINSIELLHNNSFIYSDISICGTRGWFYEEEKGIEHDKKILNRELGRLKLSLESSTTDKKIVFLHYPPIYGDYRCDEIITLLNLHNVKQCYYGHLHGRGLQHAYNGWRNSIEFKCVSADFVDFKPILVLND